MDELLERVRAAFSSVPRPAHFTNHEHCAECAEYDAALQRGEVTWDAISFVTPEAFAYLLPALAELAVEDPAEILFHLEYDGPRNERWAALSPAQRRAVAELVEHFLEHHDLGDESDQALRTLSIYCESA